MSEYKVPVQSLIDHIKTAADVDPWAKEMAERLLKEQETDIRQLRLALDIAKGTRAWGIVVKGR